MTWEGALEGRDCKATLKGYRRGLQRQNLPPVSDGTFHVGAQLPGSKACLQPIDGSFKRPVGRAQEQVVVLERNLSDGGIDAVRDDLQDSLCNVRNHKGNPMGAHDALPLILLCRALVGGGILVPGVDGRDQGDMHL